MIEYRLLTTPTAPPRPISIEVYEDGLFLRSVCSFENDDITMEEARIILSAVRRYFKR
jgi:hypothetical protein